MRNEYKTETIINNGKNTYLHQLTKFDDHRPNIESKV